MLRIDLSPGGEVSMGHDVAAFHRSLWGRGRPAGPGAGAFPKAAQ